MKDWKQIGNYVWSGTDYDSPHTNIHIWVRKGFACAFNCRARALNPEVCSRCRERFLCYTNSGKDGFEVSFHRFKNKIRIDRHDREFHNVLGFCLEQYLVGRK